jgi:hypothetical protein
MTSCETLRSRNGEHRGRPGRIFSDEGSNGVIAEVTLVKWAVLGTNGGFMPYLLAKESAP